MGEEAGKGAEEGVSRISPGGMFQKESEVFPASGSEPPHEQRSPLFKEQRFSGK